MSDEQGAMDLERPAAPSAADAAKAKVGALESKLAVLDERLATNKRTRGELAFAAHGNGDARAKRTIEDLGAEKRRLEDERTDLLAALEEGRRQVSAAEREEAIGAQRERAALARQRFTEFGKLAQAFSDAVDDVVRLFGELREAAAAVHETGFGPNERQTTRWAQRTLVFRCQHDRNLRFEDSMADGRERIWLQSAPRDWLTKLHADTAAVLGPAAEAAE